MFFLGGIKITIDLAYSNCLTAVRQFGGDLPVLSTWFVRKYYQFFLHNKTKLFIIKCLRKNQRHHLHL